MTETILAALERYYDAVPRRGGARGEDFGPLTLFVQEGQGWQYYARPALGGADATAADVLKVLERQRELKVPESFEWVAETTPSLRAAVEAAGLHVHAHPLMALDAGAEPLPPHPEVRLLGADDPLLTRTKITRTGAGLRRARAPPWARRARRSSRRPWRIGGRGAPGPRVGDARGRAHRDGRRRARRAGALLRPVQPGRRRRRGRRRRHPAHRPPPGAGPRGDRGTGRRGPRPGRPYGLPVGRGRGRGPDLRPRRVPAGGHRPDS
ncbi:acetyltransferase [Streptomyces sp. C]|nr:acetyltransferase [Streptomyces sp. C]